MHLRRVEKAEAKPSLAMSPAQQKDRSRCRSSPASRPEAPRAQDSLQWITASLTQDLVWEAEAGSQEVDP
jgi:hypothetical protein